jgi:hypothetical protein
VNHHAFAIDVADFQVCQFSASYSGGVERHQQSAMEGSAGGLNELSNFFLAEDRWQAMRPFRVGSVSDVPGSLERLTVKEPPFGALMDEYARAAEDFCRVVETFDLLRFDAERPSNNPNTISPRAICLHVIGAAHRYAQYIRKALGVEFVERYEADPARLHSPRDVRGLLTDGIVLTEQTVEPLLKATEQEIQALSFAVRWGPRYDPEMILEHAVCHLLRHRRQLERW